MATEFMILSVTLLISATVAGSSNWDVHPTPIERLEAEGIVVDVTSASDLLLDSAADSRLRVSAAYTLAQLNDLDQLNGQQAEALSTLFLAASSNDADVKLSAISALGFFPSDQCVDFLRGIVLEDSSAQARRGAVTSLHKIGTPAAASILLIAALNEFETVQTRVSAITAISTIGDQRTLEGITVLTSHEDPNIRTKSALALTRGLESRYVETIVTAAIENELELHVFTYAVERISEIAGRDFSDPIRDGNDSVRREIAEWWAGYR